jgi:signal transduction histidine kinase
MKRRENTGEIRLRHTLRWRLTLFVFSVMLVSGILTVGVYFLVLLLFRTHPIVLALTLNPIFLTATLLCVSAAIGVALSGFFGRYYLRPLKSLIRATKEIKKGNFKTQIEIDHHPESEMSTLIQSFNEMTRELDGIELFRNDFINNFSHEFKTPIVSIRGFARELQYGDLTPEQRQEYAKIIEEESDRLAKLSINVLELSRLENQQIVTDRTAFFLDEQLRQSILLCEAAWSEKEIEMVPELDEVRYFGNEELLAHIWNNLLTNAIKFTPPRGTVHVCLSANEKSVTVTVSDTGEGMTPEVMAHIFEKFYQGDSSHHKSGYGIGLTMAHRAATLCGGTITVQSKRGQGSTFTVMLPRTEEK